MGEVCNMLVSLDLFRFADTLRLIQLSRNLNYSCLLKGYVSLFKRWERNREEFEVDSPKYVGKEYS